MNFRFVKSRLKYPLRTHMNFLLLIISFIVYSEDIFTPASA
jgi:hypothetical protein